jgi:hypothetical protein
MSEMDFEPPRIAVIYYSGIRGIQSSFVGRYLGGVPGP